MEVIEREGNQLTLRVPRSAAPAITAHLLQTLPVVDLTVEDPPIEAVIDQIYPEANYESPRRLGADQRLLAIVDAVPQFLLHAGFGWMIPPLIYLLVWSTAAGEQPIGGLTRGEFVAYYLVLILVNQMTYSQTNWTVGDLIRYGQMNRCCCGRFRRFIDALSSGDGRKSGLPDL